MKYMLIILLSAFLIQCTSGSKAPKDTFVFCSVGSPSSFNPQLATDGPSFNASSSPIYNRLVEFEHGKTKLIPALAESWEISEDAKTYTFRLREDVKFHTTEYFTPTRNMNADDVIFSFMRQKDESHPYHNVSGGLYKYFESMGMGELIDSIKKIDDYTIVMQLTRPEAPFLANLAMDYASILSKEYADQLAKKNQQQQIDQQPIGTGPFQFKKYMKDSIVRFESHPAYFKGEPKIKKMVFSINTDASVRTQKLLNGECHLLNEPAPQDLEKIRASKQHKVTSAPGLNVGYLAFNTSKKPFDNKLVRQAINHALNKDSYMEAIYLNQATPAVNPLPPTIWSYNKNIEPYEYSIEKAKDLLKQAGYENGFEAELWTLPVSRPYNPNGKKMGEMMQADLAKIGIKVKLITYDWSTYLDKTRKGEHDMAQLGWSGDNGDPDNFLNILLSCEAIEGGNNISKWCDKKYSGLVQKARTETDTETRTKLYEQAQEIFHQEAPWAPIAHATVFKAMDKNLQGYKINPLSVEQFYPLFFGEESQ